MFSSKKDTVDVKKFWLDYEAAIGEKVLAKSLGRYISGCDEYAQPLFGLAIATSGGFRFRNFQQEGWLKRLSKFSSGAQGPVEKTFFIPRETISSVELVQEKRWWKKFMASSFPVLVIRFRLNGTEKEVSVEIDRDAIAVADALKG